PVNIVDLGLVYDCRLAAGEDGRTAVDIKMTLTAPGCGMGPVLAEDVKRRVEDLPGVATATVDIVFDPPWNQNMMSEAARLQLGFM
ncbi:MAG: iron-sulfur cluster assembly protein, partial [Acidobacteriota bacterium]|nr:iron-sulfur cluster assembly protein [Acidobacteriota bacterium]